MRRAILISAGLIIATCVAYWPVHQAEFINFDDPTYVTNNPRVFQGLSWAGITWAFRAVYGSNWHPLTWLSHMLDCQIFGADAEGPHLVNVALHALNAALVFLALRKMTDADWRSAFVAGLFALHPLHVESVAWISERKDVLSTFFGLLSLLAYAHYTKASGQRGYYLLSMVLYLLSLLSKPMLVTLPFVLLLLDFWPLRRLRIAWLKMPNMVSTPARTWSIIWEKLPFFALSAASSIATFLAQRQGGAVVTIKAVPLLYRCANAVISYATYLAKMFCPTDLTVFYPFSRELDLEQAGLCLLILLVVTAFALVSVRRAPYLLVGWLWYLGTLVPVIGLVQVGTQAFADRYTYVPLLGIFIALTWGMADLAGRWRLPRLALPAGAVALLAACFYATRHELVYWQDSITLFTRALELTKDNALAEHNLAHALSTKGHQTEALPHFDNALRLWPGYTTAMLNRGNALNLLGRLDEAIDQYREAIRLKPDYEQAYYYLGNALALQFKFDEARTNFLAAIYYKPDYAMAQMKLGNLLSIQGDQTGGEMHLREAVKLEPGNEENHYFLGGALARQRRFGEAAASFRTAIRISSKYSAALNDLAWILATQPDPQLRNPAEAVTLAERACKATNFQSPSYMDTLAVAYSEVGRFADAISVTEKASALAASAGDSALAAQMQKRIEMYRARQSYTSQHKAAPATSP